MVERGRGRDETRETGSWRERGSRRERGWSEMGMEGRDGYEGRKRGPQAGRGVRMEQARWVGRGKGRRQGEV